MQYSNSKLVSYTRLSPNNSGKRKHAIDTITIHCVVGQCSVETLGRIFEPASRQASCNYGIGCDGRIGLYCEEKNTSWCSSSYSNDSRAVTIEVASSREDPYEVSDIVYKSLINLLVDICNRNSIHKLLWRADKDLVGQVEKQNMTVHRWFANKGCPGDWLYSRHGEIADLVNQQLAASNIKESNIVVGDAVKLVKNAKQFNGNQITSPYNTMKYNVSELSNNRAVLSIGETVMYAVNTDDLVRVSTDNTDNTDNTDDTDDSILVKINCDYLNIRSGPGTSCDIVGSITDRGTYTIVKQDSTDNWGKLKSGAGWIHLAYTIMQ